MKRLNDFKLSLIQKMNSSITFKRISGNGENMASFNLKQNDVSTDRLALLFKLNSESIFLTNEITNEGK